MTAHIIVIASLTIHPPQDQKHFLAALDRWGGYPPLACKPNIRPWSLQSVIVPWFLHTCDSRSSIYDPPGPCSRPSASSILPRRHRPYLEAYAQSFICYIIWHKMALPTLVIVIVACSIGIPFILTHLPRLLASILLNWSSIVRPFKKLIGLLSDGAVTLLICLLSILCWVTSIMCSYQHSRMADYREELRNRRLRRKEATSFETRLAMLEGNTATRQEMVPRVRLPEVALHTRRSPANGPSYQARPRSTEIPAVFLRSPDPRVEERLPDYEPPADGEAPPTYEAAMGIREVSSSWVTTSPDSEQHSGARVGEAEFVHPPHRIDTPEESSSWVTVTPDSEQHSEADVGEEEVVHPPYTMGIPLVTGY